MHANDTDEATALKPLKERIVELLRTSPGLKGSDIAVRLNVDRRDVNRCLSYELAGLVVQDVGYRWRLRVEGTGVKPLPGAEVKALTEIGRLSRYYLECIGHDSDEGVSTFAASRYGEPDYASLPALPMTSGHWDWWNAPGVARVLSAVKADRTNLQAWLGYPIRLREHRTARWRGFFVEPVFLWPIELPEHPGDPVRLLVDQPQPNFSVLRAMAMGDAAALVEEAARLDEDLGLNNGLEDRPETDELIERLVKVRPDWDWRETIDPYALSEGEPLSSIDQVGIFNRAVVIPGKRSPYTQGLEAELKNLGEIDERELDGTALGKLLLGTTDAEPERDDKPLIEVVPMNLEQREAVSSALVAPLTVVTGPPGTGKSQVVTNLMVNAAWRGMKVLFASKNNKAVDVVEARVNGLGNRPVLLRLGSKEYQAKLATYLTAMLSGQVSEDDRTGYEENLKRHEGLVEKLAHLDRLQQQTVEARNQVDRLEAAVEEQRALLGEERFNTLDEELLVGARSVLTDFNQAIDAMDPSKLSVLGRMGLMLGRTRRLGVVREKADQLAQLAQHLGGTPLVLTDDSGPEQWRTWAEALSGCLNAALDVLAYQAALDRLRSGPALEQLALEKREVSAQIADNSTKLWRDWVQLAPSRLNAAQRKDMADYAALLQVITGPEGDNANTAVRNRARALQSKVSALFSCWAVTSLSARGKVPFEPAHFDLVVIDEAGQCDIASALPLLFRAKRAVIIGDPMQLRHISALGRNKDADLLHKFNLLETRAGWMYSVNSLFDLSAGLAQASQIINLRDHHRSHGDIIDFSNQFFYGNRLRVATRYTSLRKPSNRAPGVYWQDVEGQAIRPLSGGAQNLVEAKAVVEALQDLLLTRQFPGTVGVVTPFRAQAQLIQSLVAKAPGLVETGARNQLMVDTVHKFQGDERDVMFFSPVVSAQTPDGALGFLRGNGNLFNVAITRARGLLHVVGHRVAATNCGVDYMEAFAAYVARLEGRGEGRTAMPPEPLAAPDYPTVPHPERVSEWERVFYRALFAAGVRSIPQFHVEQYDLDFAVFAGGRRLNIEVDGERYHRSWTGELCLRDQLRNQRLIELGWEVKRFWVYEIRDRLPECVQFVTRWVEQAGDGDESSLSRGRALQPRLPGVASVRSSEP